MDGMESITIVIPNYNGDILLERNIPFVVKAAQYFQKNTNNTIGIIIIDDASTDQSLSVLEELQNAYGKKIPFKVLINKKNLGFASTVNKGVKHAASEFVMLLNTDVRPSENFLIPLYKHFGSEKMFAVGCLEKSIEGERVVERGRGIAKWRRGLYIHSWGKPNDDSTAWVSGGSGMFRKSIWDLLGGLQEIYDPFYWEDIDLSYRAQKFGYDICFEKNSVVTHKHSEGAIQSTVSKSRVQKIAFRNQFFFIWINITDLTLILTHIAFLPIHLCKALFRFDMPYLYGFMAAIVNLPRICTVRGRQKLMIARPDKSLQLTH